METLSSSLQNLPIVKIIFDENATATDLLHVVAATTIWWGIFFFVFIRIVRIFIRGKPWIAAAGSRDFDRGGKELYDGLGIPITRKDFIRTFEDNWPWTQAVICQHFVGGILALPAVLNLFDNPQLQSSLACLSVLSEMGWEIGDELGWLYTRYFTRGGKTKAPMALIILLAIHHSLTVTLGIPMILHYRHNHYFHWLTFDLQLAAAVALSVTEYTKLLDISNLRQLRQFQILTGFCVVVMLFTRGFHWVYLCSMLIYSWYQEKVWTFMVVGTICSLLFSTFNVFFCIEPFIKRFIKFMKVSHEYEKLPANVDSKQRRASMVSLQEAAANVMVGQDGMNAELLQLLQLNERTPNKSNRRDTIPPSMFGSGRRRSSSAALLRNSMGDVSIALQRLQAAVDLKEE